MPELPEMETYRTLLGSLIGGQKISEVEIGREKSINVPVDMFTMQVSNQNIKTITRRAKYLIFQLQDGKCLLLHLMLGGWMFFGNEEEKPNRTIQVKLSFGDQHLYFIGLRLGYLHLLSPEEVDEEFKKLGPEVLEPDFTLDAFLQIMQKRKGTIKTTLLNQEVLAGIGNGYSDEILWIHKFALIKKSMILTINNYHGYIIRFSSSLKGELNKVVIWKIRYIKEMPKQEAINFMFMTEKVKHVLAAMLPL